MPLMKPIGANQRKRLKKESYSALGPRFDNRLELNQKARLRAGQEGREKLKPIREEGTAEAQAHAGRSQDIEQSYGYLQQQAQEAYQRTLDAQDKLLATGAASVGQGQDTLAGALASTRASDNATAQSIGGSLPAGNQDPTAQAVTATGAASMANLGADVGQVVGTAAQAPVRSALGKTRAVETEDQRNAAKREQLQKLKREVKSELPALKEKALEDLEQGELAKQTERNREKIAKGALHNEGRQTTTAEKEQAETAKQDEAENAIAWGTINAEKQKFQSELKLATEEGASKSEIQAIKARGEQYQQGVDTMQEYVNNTKPKQRNPGTLYKTLTASVPPKMALKIMEHVAGHEFAAFVQKKRTHGKSLSKDPNGSSLGR